MRFDFKNKLFTFLSLVALLFTLSNSWCGAWCGTKALERASLHDCCREDPPSALKDSQSCCELCKTSALQALKNSENTKDSFFISWLEMPRSFLSLPLTASEKSQTAFDFSSGPTHSLYDQATAFLC